MGTSTQQVETRIEIDDAIALGLSGIIQITDRYTARGGDSYNQLGKLTDQELATICNCVSNEEEAMISGLQTLGNLDSSYDSGKGGDLDCNGVGWLVKTMADNLHCLKSMSWSATDELARRGYNESGYLLPSQPSSVVKESRA